MLSVDFHSHSIYSLCGIHTHLELLTEARRIGLQVLAITDHGPAMEGRCPSVLYERFRNPVEGVRLLKGIESNLLSEPGSIDVPKKFLKYMDVVLLGIHPNTKSGLDSRHYTDMLCAAMQQNPCIDIITHINDPVYPVEYAEVAACAARLGIAIELNNSKTQLQRTTPERTEALLLACKAAGCRIAVTSDTHAITELGHDEAVQPYLQRCAYPEQLIVSRSVESALAFVEERRGNKHKAI